MDLRATWARISERWNLTGEDLRQAREVCAEWCDEHGQAGSAERFRAGELDNSSSAQIALKALRVGRGHVSQA